MNGLKKFPVFADRKLMRNLVTTPAIVTPTVPTTAIMFNTVGAKSTPLVVETSV